MKSMNSLTHFQPDQPPTSSYPLQMCSECEEHKKFDALLMMARKCLPQETVNLDTIVADCKLRWKTTVDGELASAIIYGMAKKPSPKPAMETLSRGNELHPDFVDDIEPSFQS